MSQVPAHDLDAERALLGSILIDAGQGIKHLAAVQSVITSPEMFYSDAHREIWTAMLAIGDGLDSLTLAAKLTETGTLEAAGGRPYVLKGLPDAVATSAHVEHYARIVAKRHYEREIVRESRKLAESQETANVDAITSLVLAKMGLDVPQVFDYSMSLHDALEEILDPKREPPCPFHLKPLDEITDGLKRGEVNCFGAGTNQGKSILLLNLMHLQAMAGARCLFVGSEMTARETFQRHVSLESGIEAWKIRLGKLNPQNIEDRSSVARITAATANLSELPISILDDPEPSIERIEATIAQTKADAVFIDYLERMQLPEAKDMRLRVKEFMRRLKNVARRRNVIVFLASQLNRKTYATGAEECPPALADLSESSAIEKESDRVFLIWRPKMLQPQIVPGTANYRAVLEIVKAKDRHGPNGLKAHLEFDGTTLRIGEVHNVPA